MTKIICISDTHGAHNKLEIPECDVLIHAGDWTTSGTMKQVKEFAEWFRSLDQASEKICIPGNHDIVAESYTDFVRDEFPSKDGIHLLIDEHVTVEGIKYWGSPYTSRFGVGYAFQVDRGSAARAHWSQIPSDANVIITHGPPKGYADLAVDFNWDPTSIYGKLIHAGDNQLREKLAEIKPRFHVCGHMHGGYGIHPTEFGTVVVNAAVSADRHNVSNFNPIVVHYY